MGSKYALSRSSQRVREESKEVKPFRAGIELPVFNLKSHKLSVSE